MFTINKPFSRPNISKTIRFTEQLDRQLSAVAEGEGISFNEMVLRCCEYALKHYGGEIDFVDKKRDREEIFQLVQQHEKDTQEEYHIELFKSGEHLLESGFRPDILFLDIIMDERDGIQIGEEIKNRYAGTIIIYITTISEKMPEAINRIHSFGYLVKPIVKKDLFRIMSDAVEQVKRSNNVPYVTFLSENRAVINLAVTDIYYFEYCNRKIKIVTKDKTYTCIQEKISDIAGKMQPYGFAMSHQSFVVNLYQVEAISEQMLLIKNGTRVYLAQKRASSIRKQLMKIAQKSLKEIERE